MTPTSSERYWNPYFGGALLGIVLFLAFFLTGGGLGASGGMLRVLTGSTRLVAPQKVQESSYMAHMAGGAKNPWQDGSVWMLAGTLLGGLLSGLLHRRVRWEIRRGKGVSGPLRLFMAFLGGGFMGFGARLARGCTSGQALSGGAVLSVGSWAFMMCIFAAGYALAVFFAPVWKPEESCSR